MGDRSNIYFHNSDIGLYSHWHGKDMARAAIAVLNNPAFKARIGDPSYAARIGVQTLFETLGASSASDTGFGLWTSKRGMPDNEYRVIVIDTLTGSIYVVSEDYMNPREEERVENPTIAKLESLM